MTPTAAGPPRSPNRRASAAPPEEPVVPNLSLLRLPPTPSLPSTSPLIISPSAGFVGPDLYPLSPLDCGRLENDIIRAVAAPSQRRALGVLFAVLALAFGGIAVAAGSAEQWVILVASAVLTLWMAGLALRALRH